MAVMSAFVSTGGIQQFATMRMTYYRQQGNRPLERFVMSRAVLLGIVAVLVSVAVVSLAAVSVIGLPRESVVIVAIYGSLVGVARLLAIPQLVRKSFAEMLFVSLVALGVMFGLYRYLEPLTDRTSAVLLSQVAGLAVLCVVGVALVARYFRRSAGRATGPDDPPFYARADAPRQVRAPRLWSLVAAGTPQLLYGTMFFVFLYTDRILSWARSADGAYILAYNYRYQLGVDLALLTLVPITVAKYPMITKLIDEFLRLAYETSIADGARIPKLIQRLIATILVRITVVSAILCAVAFAAATPLVGFAGGDEEIARAFRYGVIGVFFFAVFLANSAIAMNFNWTMDMAVLLVVASCCDLLVGAIAVSRFGLNASVAGFIAGSLFLAAASTYMLVSRKSALVFAFYAAR
jgi:O-antigen/teichoic acid export membrane protein